MEPRPCFALGIPYHGKGKALPDRTSLEDFANDAERARTGFSGHPVEGGTGSPVNPLAIF